MRRVSRPGREMACLGLALLAASAMGEAKLQSRHLNPYRSHRQTPHQDLGRPKTALNHLLKGEDRLWIQLARWTGTWFLLP